MHKRTFLKLSSAMLAVPLLSPLSAWSAGEKLKNWAGNLTYSTDRLTTAKSLDQAKAFVKQHAKFKVLGTRHCFNTIADTSTELLSLKDMHEVISLDAKARKVTIQAGMNYGQLSPYLHSKGFAVHNLASLPHISVAGACATATHGSGNKNGNLATAVSGLEIINAKGDVVQLSKEKDGDTFNGAVVNLGALGVITKVTLDIEPTFSVRQYVYENLPLDQLKAHFDEITGSAYSVSLFTDWKNKRFNEVWIKSRVGKDKPFEAKAEFYGAKKSAKNLHPIAELSAENCTEQLGVAGPWFERLPHFKMGFTPSSGKELQSEYFVPRRNAVDAILAVERLHAQISPHLMITEIRTIAADTLWMSPCYKQDSVAIHFTWQQDWPAVSKVLPQIEKALAPYNVRPHWGKLFSVAPSVLQSRYERLDDFKKLVQTYDPQGKFRNDFLSKNLYGK